MPPHAPLSAPLSSTSPLRRNDGTGAGSRIGPAGRRDGVNSASSRKALLGALVRARRPTRCSPILFFFMFFICFCLDGVVGAYCTARVASFSAV